jgi:transcriptional regulator with XRE-family HTH domain
LSFSRDLRAARKAAQLTQADAAKVCGIGKRTFEKWEAGELSPPPEAGAITRERVLARLAPAVTGSLGNPNTRATCARFQF